MIPDGYNRQPFHTGSALGGSCGAKLGFSLLLVFVILFAAQEWKVKEGRCRNLFTPLLLHPSTPQISCPQLQTPHKMDKTQKKFSAHFLHSPKFVELISLSLSPLLSPVAGEGDIAVNINFNILQSFNALCFLVCSFQFSINWYSSDSAFIGFLVQKSLTLLQIKMDPPAFCQVNIYWQCLMWRPIYQNDICIIENMLKKQVSEKSPLNICWLHKQLPFLTIYNSYLLD